MKGSHTMQIARDDFLIRSREIIYNREIENTSVYSFFLCKEVADIYVRNKPTWRGLERERDGVTLCKKR